MTIKENAVLVNASVDLGRLIVTINKLIDDGELIIKDGSLLKAEAKDQIVVPAKEVFDLYRDICKDLKQHVDMTSSMRVLIRKRFVWVMRRKHYTENYQALEWFKSFFNNVHKNDYLCGRKFGKAWKADLNWLMVEANFMKVLSNFYV
jgi:hypothetical protein